MNYLTLNNAVFAVALLVGASWTWGSIGMMQRNYDLQKRLTIKQREQRIVELEIDNLTYRQRYHESDEYKELAARKYLGLAAPGEKVLILPPGSREISSGDPEKSELVEDAEPPSNIKQWVNFLLGSNRRNLQG